MGDNNSDTDFSLIKFTNISTPILEIECFNCNQHAYFVRDCPYIQRCGGVCILVNHSVDDIILGRKCTTKSNKMYVFSKEISTKFHGILFNSVSTTSIANIVVYSQISIICQLC